MTEHRTVINVSTGKTEIVEYYTHDEFMERKRAKLEECEARAVELCSKNLNSMSQLERVHHSIQVVHLFAEWQMVLSAVGPMAVSTANSD